MVSSSLRSGSHSVFNIQLHIGFVTKYRRKVITVPMIDRLREIFAKICVGQKCILVEFNGEADHVHLLVDTHPDNNIAKLVGSMKAASSRLIGEGVCRYSETNLLETCVLVRLLLCNIFRWSASRGFEEVHTESGYAR